MILEKEEFAKQPPIVVPGRLDSFVLIEYIATKSNSHSNKHKKSGSAIKLTESNDSQLTVNLLFSTLTHASIETPKGHCSSSVSNHQQLQRSFRYFDLDLFLITAPVDSVSHSGANTIKKQTSPDLKVLDIVKSISETYGYIHTFKKRLTVFRSPPSDRRSVVRDVSKGVIDHELDFLRSRNVGQHVPGSNNSHSPKSSPERSKGSTSPTSVNHSKIREPVFY